MNDFESARQHIVTTASSDPTRALTLADELVENWPERSASWSVRSHVLWLLGRREEALSDSDKAISVDPEEPSNYFHKGDFLIETEDFAGAIDLFSKSISLGKKYEFDNYESSCRMFRAFCLYQIGNFDEAILDLQRVDDTGTFWIGGQVTRDELIEACRKKFGEIPGT